MQTWGEWFFAPQIVGKELIWRPFFFFFFPLNKMGRDWGLRRREKGCELLLLI